MSRCDDMRQAASSQQASWQAACAQPSRSCAGCGSSNGSGRIQIHTHTHKQADKAYIHTGNKQHREQRHTHTHALRETKSFIYKHIYRISWQYRDKLGSSTQTLVIETCQLPPPPPYLSLTPTVDSIGQCISTNCVQSCQLCATFQLDTTAWKLYP